jgi:hypothetical protein
VGKISKTVVLLFACLSLSFTGCGSNYTKNNVYNIDRFENQLKLKNYKIELIDVGKDFLPTIRKRILIGDEAIDVYLYTNCEDVDKDSRRIDSGGCSYTNGKESVKVNWTSFPHFYKKGNIIVQYVGENEKIISDLKEILGEQFAGYKQD